MLSYFGVELAWDEPTAGQEVWPTGLAPFIRLSEDGSGNKKVEGGTFGLLPHFATEVAYGRRTYNARSETVHQKPSFRDAWRKGQRCIIPAEWIYEPCYESGRPVRHLIRRVDGCPMGIAGIYNPWTDANGRTRGTFAMLTVSGAGHPVFQRMHGPNDEKRMVVILHEEDYDRWLACSPEEARAYFVQWDGALVAEAAPLPPRAASRKG
jgi:putative SOS response-associated peptidase YedK